MANETPPKDFVQLFIDFYRNFESPTAFWKWGAFSTIAATLRSKVYFDYGAGKIYPNIYVVLLAESAQFRKGAAVIASRKLLNLVKPTKVFSGTASIQALLEELSLDVANKSTGVPIKGGGCLITADELASFFVADPRLIPLVTDIWEPRIGEDDPYDYKLRGGSIRIKDLCVSMLAASNETFLREVYDSRAVYGGLLGRTFMIKPDETRPANSLMDEDVAAYDVKPLTDALFKIRDLKGPVRKTPEAAKYYKQWYTAVYNSYSTHPDKTGVLQRMHTNVVKLAIILAAANYTLEITEEIFARAINEVDSLKQNYDLYVMSSGKASMAQIASKFVADLWTAAQSDEKHILRKDWLFKNWNDVSAEDFDKLIVTLQQGGVIDTGVNGKGEIYYYLTDKGKNYFKNKIGEKK